MSNKLVEEVKSLRKQVQDLNAEKSILTRKLKEATAVRSLVDDTNVSLVESAQAQLRVFMSKLHTGGGLNEDQLRAYQVCLDIIIELKEEQCQEATAPRTK